jgi:hypothetical protein
MEKKNAFFMANVEGYNQFKKLHDYYLACNVSTYKITICFLKNVGFLDFQKYLEPHFHPNLYKSR